MAILVLRGQPFGSGNRASRRACQLAACLLVVCGVLLSAGCSRSKGEPRIIGKSSDAPVSLQCAWHPGFRYHLRLDLSVLTDAEKPEPDEAGLSSVVFAQECLVTATNAARGGNLGLDMEILSIAMDRAKGGQFTLSYDSNQGGEMCDDAGYIPILKKLVGGHLRFLVSPDGRMLRIDGLNEWLASALGEAAPAPRPMRAPPSGPNAPGNAGGFLNTVAGLAQAIFTGTNAAVPPPAEVTLAQPVSTSAADVSVAPPVGPPPLNVMPGSNAPPKAVRRANRVVTANPGGPAGARRNAIANTIRNFFTADYFRELIEFHYLPPNPVRVGATWPTQGEIAVTGRGRFHVEATGKFRGWQRHGETNAARVELSGQLLASGNTAPPGTNAPATSNTKKHDITGTVWIDPSLNFPVTTVLDKEVSATDRLTVRRGGTNGPVVNMVPKLVRQNMVITLLVANPIAAPSVAAAPVGQ